MQVNLSYIYILYLALFDLLAITKYLLLFFTAHEITHAFDDVGIQYDSTGSFRALYDNETLSKFHEASGIVINQLIKFILLI